MFLTDPIADMLTRIRNASAASHERADIPHSKEKEAIASVLKEQGYILNYKTIQDGNKKNIRVYLKYVDGQKVIKGLKRISKPGRRVYSGATEMPRVLSGLGVAVVSTPKGVVTDKFCRENNVGGEVICFVW